MILFLGDTHAQLMDINRCIDKVQERGFEKPYAVVVVGDFGVFSDVLRPYMMGDKKFNTKVFFIDGNHEDHSLLKKGHMFHEYLTSYTSNPQYIDRAQQIAIGSTTILGLGGAKSVDGSHYKDIDDKDIGKALATNRKFTFIISHECPAGLGVEGSWAFRHARIPGDQRLKYVLDELSPKFWLFGHYHKWFRKQYKDTLVIGLPEAINGGVLYDPKLKEVCELGWDICP